MASLRQLIREHRNEICDGVAWVAIYKDGRSWEAEAFYPDDGNYVNGYAFDGHDYARMTEIVETDCKALCVNGHYSEGLGNLSLKKLEDKLLLFYISRHQQLYHFVEDFVYPPKTYDLYENKGLSAEQLREEYREMTGVDNDHLFTDEEIYRYLLEALYEEGDPSIDALLASASQRAAELSHSEAVLRLQGLGDREGIAGL